MDLGTSSVIAELSNAVDILLREHQCSDCGRHHSGLPLLPSGALSYRIYTVYRMLCIIHSSADRDANSMDSTLGWLMFYVLNTGVITW